MSVRAGRVGSAPDRPLTAQTEEAIDSNEKYSKYRFISFADIDKAMTELKPRLDLNSNQSLNQCSL